MAPKKLLPVAPPLIGGLNCGFAGAVGLGSVYGAIQLARIARAGVA